MITKEDERWMRQAILEAEAAGAEGEVPVGAVIVSRNRIVGRGHNMTEALKDVPAHAAIMAITAAANTLGGKYLPDCTIYVTVEPCMMCAGALGWCQIGRIVYGTPDVKRGFLSYFGNDPSPLHPKTIVDSGLLADDCAALMSDFFKLRRK